MKHGLTVCVGAAVASFRRLFGHNDQPTLPDALAYLGRVKKQVEGQTTNMRYICKSGKVQTMSRRKQQPNPSLPIDDFRHAADKRVNNPPAGMAPTYEVQQRQASRYAYNPHLDPQLVWAGKAEHTSFEVEVVSLHIHERISTKAILEAVRRPQPLQMDLFGETPLPADQEVEFYQHEVGWANRLILGDSLLVMNSLLVKEGMAGKVQMIYIDPPYGIKYASNFQPRIDRRDVKDKDEDLTHEPEQIKAYRDTWQLGIHSYLTYLRDRLLLARELLTESGSIFVQINDENLHLVRCLLDEVFGRGEFRGGDYFRQDQRQRGRYPGQRQRLSPLVRQGQIPGEIPSALSGEGAGRRGYQRLPARTASGRCPPPPERPGARIACPPPRGGSGIQGGQYDVSRGRGHHFRVSV